MSDLTEREQTENTLRAAKEEAARQVRELPAYEVLESRWVEELNSEAVICRHKKSGARLFLLSNDDNNKVFTIGFRTPPADSTGLPHILEHSVLCGSKKFPAKDPFVELVKGSLNTFINAMTYPDKTIYPVASCNDKDFQNLMDVYMDAVLHPNVCENEKIFRQEGWHYEMEDMDSELKINGVVYNEMIGAYSQPDQMLSMRTDELLYPDSCYRFSSGGYPDDISKLSYEDFLKFYHTYYHPSNSYIYLYGDMNMAEKLTWLDEEYLHEYDYLEVDSHIPEQKPFAVPAEGEILYPLTEDEDEAQQTYLSVNMVTGDSLDPRLYVAFQILEYALLNAPGAPLKQTLLDAGIGKDVYGGYSTSIQQPNFSVIAKNADADQKEEFCRLVEAELRRLAKEGIDRRSLLAGLNYYEFKYRESDFGPFPKGLMYGIQCFDSWIYDEKDPLMHLTYEDTFRFLKEELENGYFEQLIREYLLDNPHSAVVVARPQKGLNEEKEAALAEKLAALKASMTGEQLQAVVKQTEELRQYQEEPTDPEILKLIPMLSREDIERKVMPFNWTESRENGVTVLHHNMFTAGIGYLRLLFNTEAVADEDLPYLGLLCAVLGYMDTENYDYRQLFNEIHIQTGGISTAINSYAYAENPGAYRSMFEFSAKTFYDKIGFTFEMIEEMIRKTIFDDEKRLKEIISEKKSRAQKRLLSGGDTAAVLRATSYFSESACFGELTGGISYYKFLENLDAHFEEQKAETIAKLKQLTAQIFTKEHLLVSYTANENGFDEMKEPLTAFVNGLSQETFSAVDRHLVTGKKNEGFLSSSGVQYVAQCGNFRDAGLEYTGALRILQLILSYDYLWIQLRVKGGAYGCMGGFNRSGESYFVSYRDPHLKQTLNTYQGIPEYLRNFDADEREMTKYIIGTISEMDTPLNPSAKGSRSLTSYLCHTNEEMIQKYRDQVLTAQPEDIRALADYVEAILGAESICVVGNAQKCKEDASALKELCSLFE